MWRRQSASLLDRPLSAKDGRVNSVLRGLNRYQEVIKFALTSIWPYSMCQTLLYFSCYASGTVAAIRASCSGGLRFEIPSRVLLVLTGFVWPVLIPACQKLPVWWLLGGYSPWGKSNPGLEQVFSFTFAPCKARPDNTQTATPGTHKNRGHTATNPKKDKWRSRKLKSSKCTRNEWRPLKMVME
jgi:hypothetical protein